MASVSRNIALLRAQRGLSQEQLAQTLHVTRQTVSSWETGRTAPDVDTLGRIAAALDADIAQLIYGLGRAANEKSLRAARYVRTGFLCCTLLFALLMAIGAHAYMRGDRLMAPFWEKYGTSISSADAPDMRAAFERTKAMRRGSGLVTSAAAAFFPIAVLAGLCAWVLDGVKLRLWQPMAAVAAGLALGALARLPFLLLGDGYFWNYYLGWVNCASRCALALGAGYAAYGIKHLLELRRKAGEPSA